MKIENKVKEMPAVSEATVDFVSKKLRVEVANKRELEATVANITNVVQKLEPDVKVVREEKNGHDHGHSHDHGEANVKKMVGRLVVGGILTAILCISELTTNGNNSVIRPCLFINRWRYRLESGKKHNSRPSI